MIGFSRKDRHFDANKDRVFGNLQTQLTTVHASEAFDIIVLFEEDFQGLDPKELTTTWRGALEISRSSTSMTM